MLPAANEPYAKYLRRLVKAWPADLRIGWMTSSGGIPPTVSQWSVDRKGIGQFEQVDYPHGEQTNQKWPVKLAVKDLKALLGALTAVDFENARKPTPDSPVQMLSIQASGQTGYLDAFALLPPVASDAVQAKVLGALGRLLGQCHREAPKP